jgi:hypothetical protein
MRMDTYAVERVARCGPSVLDPDYKADGDPCLQYLDGSTAADKDCKAGLTFTISAQYKHPEER